MAITQKTRLLLEYGWFSIAYHKVAEGECVSVSLGDLAHTIPVLRIHSSCLFGEAFHGLDCDCAAQLSSTFKLIAENGSGAIVYSYAEGRGVGLEKKIQALELQRTRGLNTVEAFEELGLPVDLRTYEKEILALQDLQVNRQVKVATQNPAKLTALRDAGYEVVEQLHPAVQVTKYNSQELMAKKALGYDIRQQEVG